MADVQLRRDPFARETLMRRNVPYGILSCRNCGGRRRHGGLFLYGVARDDKNYTEWDHHKFCCLSCRMAYYGK